jgi:isopentenyl-diphosphate Delta-isomerase
MTEYFEIFTSDNQPLHILKPRHQVHRDGDWHRTVQVFVINPQEHLLCNLRSAAKDVYPRFWDVSVGGHVAPEEPLLHTALRELKEELGIQVRPHELRFLTHYSSEGYDETTQHTDREHAAVFLYKTHLTCPDFDFAKDEIDAIEFLPIHYLKQNFLSSLPEIRIIPMGETYARLLDEIEDGLVNLGV